MLNWNSNRELDRASISNFKVPGLEIQKGNCSKLSFISDVYAWDKRLGRSVAPLHSSETSQKMFELT